MRSSIKKDRQSRKAPVLTQNRTKNAFPLIEEFLNEIGLKTLCGQPFDWERVEIRGDKAYYLPPVAHNFRGITFLRNGLYLGDLKKNRFEPLSHLHWRSAKMKQKQSSLSPLLTKRITRYLKGETLNIEPEEAAHKKRLASPLCRWISHWLR